jgi:hypothetical protein
MDEYRQKKALIVCNEREERFIGKIIILPWRRFPEELWAGRIIS